MNINLTLLGQMITFLVFIWFTMRYVWPPITKAMHERQQRIAEGLAAAERGQRDLELAQHKTVELMRDAKLEASQIIEQANKRALQIVEESKEQARQESLQILQRANSEVEQMVMSAKDSLRKELADLVIDGAEKVIKTEINPAVHQKMLADLIAEL